MAAGFGLGLAPAYDIFGVVSLEGVMVSGISEYCSSENLDDVGLKNLKIDQIMLQILATISTRKVYTI